MLLRLEIFFNALSILFDRINEENITSSNIFLYTGAKKNVFHL